MNWYFLATCIVKRYVVDVKGTSRHHYHHHIRLYQLTMCYPILFLVDITNGKNKGLK